MLSANNLFKHAVRLIRAAEEMYGPRDHEFTFIGIELVPEIVPQRTPAKVQGRTLPDLKRKQVYIRLRDDMTVGSSYFVLAHECVHLLSPGFDVLRIEEGAADVFADAMMRQIPGMPAEFRGRPRDEEHERYNNAENDVREINSMCPNAIRELRRIQPAFSLMRGEDFDAIGIHDAALIDRLLTRF